MLTGSFFRYHQGEAVAPVLTIFIGGNHEASNHLQELAYGGWVAPNIYYLGYAGVVQVNEIRIAGISGIYRGYNYEKGHYEITPYDNDTMRSVYSIRKLEVFRLSQLTPSKIDIMLSHDWPSNIWEHGDNSKTGTKEGLLRFKPAFKQDMDSGRMGSKPCWELLNKLKPKKWYAAHMHCRFDAVVKHESGEETKFVALDKCLPRRQFFEFIDLGEEVERNEDGMAKIEFKYDPEWLAILSLTNHLLNCTPQRTMIPLEKHSQSNNSRWNFNPTEEEIQKVAEKFGNNLGIPNNFKQIVQGYDPQWDGKFSNLKQPNAVLNPQTQDFCDKLGIDDPLKIVAYLRRINIEGQNIVDPDAAFREVPQPGKTLLSLPKPVNSEEIDLDSLDDGEAEVNNTTNSFEPNKKSPKSPQTDSSHDSPSECKRSPNSFTSANNKKKSKSPKLQDKHSSTTPTSYTSKLGKSFENKKEKSPQPMENNNSEFKKEKSKSPPKTSQVKQSSPTIPTEVRKSPTTYASILSEDQQKVKRSPPSSPEDRISRIQPATNKRSLKKFKRRNQGIRDDDDE